MNRDPSTLDFRRRSDRELARMAAVEGWPTSPRSRRHILRQLRAIMRSMQGMTARDKAGIATLYQLWKKRKPDPLASTPAKTHRRFK
jgi:hypothetical protein